MTASTIASVETMLAADLGTITGLKVYTNEPTAFDSLPAICLWGPSVERVALDTSDTQLGSLTLTLIYEFTLAVALDAPLAAQTQIKALIGQVVGAIDNDAHAGGVIDMKVLSGQMAVTASDAKRQMVLYGGELAVLLET